MQALIRRGIRGTAVAMTLALAARAEGQVGTWYVNQGVTYPGTNSMSVWASSSSDIWLSGGVQNLQHYDGNSWSMPTQPGTINRYYTFGFGPGQVYTTGQNGFATGAVHSCTTTACGVVHYAPVELAGIWGRSASDLYVGGDGYIARYNGAGWTSIATGLSQAFNTNRFESISGGETRTFFAGRNGMIFSYDGSVLSQMLTGTTVHLSSISAVNDNLAFAVGANGTILRWDGAAWTAMNSGTTEHLNGVFAMSGSGVYVTGNNGTVLYFNGTSWVPVDIGTGGTLGTPFALSETQVYIPRANGSFGELITSDAALGGRLLIQSTVPEPSTVALVASGLGALLFARRRRKAV